MASTRGAKMTNRERLIEIQRSIADGLMDLLKSTLQFTDYDSITRKSWGEATSALRSVQEAVKLLSTIAYIDEELDTESLPELSNNSMNLYGSTFGNRCYWQNIVIEKWLKGNSDSDTGIADHRFDLDFDIIETTETTETTTKKTTKRKRGNTISIDELVEKK